MSSLRAKSDELLRRVASEVSTVLYHKVLPSKHASPMLASGTGASGRRGRLQKPRPSRPLPVPARIATATDLDTPISRLQALHADLDFTDFDAMVEAAAYLLEKRA